MWQLFKSVGQDARLGLRLLFRNPGFTAAAVLSLALGIGANSAVFSVVNTVLFTPVPGVDDPSSLVAVWESREGQPQTRFRTSYPAYLEFAGMSDVFSGLAAFSTDLFPIGTVSGESDKVWASMVTPNYFSILGVNPVRGRILDQKESPADSARAAVIGEALWKRVYGARESVIGSQISVKGHAFTVIGVLPEGFRGTRLDIRPEIWIPLSARQIMEPGSDVNTPGTRWLFTVGRTKPGVSLEQARGRVQATARQFRERYPDEQSKNTAVLISVAEEKIAPALRKVILSFAGLLEAVVLLVLLIACANVANLLLARWARRQTEMSIRLGLGASRARILRQLITESVLLALLGGLGGLLMAYWTGRLLSGYRLSGVLPFDMDLTLDSHVFLFALVFSLLTGVGFGIAPALYSARSSLVQSLRSGAGQVVGLAIPSRRLQSLFVTSQIAFSVLLLVVAGLFIRSLQKAQEVDLGFRAENLLLFTVDLAAQDKDDQVLRMNREIAENLAALPGVQAVGLADCVPLVGGLNQTSVTPAEKIGTPEEGTNPILYNTISAGYFKAMGAVLLQGRDFSTSDSPQSLPVVIINQATAAKFWPGENPIGRRLRLGGSKKPLREVIGVVRNWKYQSVWEAPEPAAFIPLLQSPEKVVTVHLRAQNPAALLRPALDTLQSIDRELPVFDVRTFQDQLASAFVGQRIGSWLVGLFGLLGLLLATVGIAGVVSYSVAMRTREIGVRMALGARPATVLWVIVKEKLVLAGVGVGIGLILAISFTRFLTSMLPGISATDPVVFAGIAAVSAVVTLVACLVPARRAVRVTPVEALRYE